MVVARLGNGLNAFGCTQHILNEIGNAKELWNEIIHYHENPIYEEGA